MTNPGLGIILPAVAVKTGIFSSPSAQRGANLLRSLAPDEVVQEVGDRFGAFIEQRINPGAAQRDREGRPISKELLKEAGGLGLMGFTVPQEVGGQSRRWRDWGWVLHEIGYLSQDTSFPMLLAYCGTVTKLLYETGRPDLIDRYVRPMARGECLGGFGWSEGHDPFSFTTTALKAESGGYILNGEKIPIANGLIGDVFMIFAAESRTKEVLCLLVESADPGVEISPYNAMGLRAAGLARVKFKDVRIPSQRVLVESDALSYGQRFLNERRLEMPCWALGKMRQLFERCVEDLSGRIRFRLPVVEMQAVQAAIGKMYISLETSRMVAADMLGRVDEENHDSLWDPPLAVSKCHVVEQALQLCRTIQDITGGAGVFEAGPYERGIRDLQCLNPIAGTIATLQTDLGILAVNDVRRLKRKKGGTT